MITIRYPLHGELVLFPGFWAHTWIVILPNGILNFERCFISKLALLLHFMIHFRIPSSLKKENFRLSPPPIQTLSFIHQKIERDIFNVPVLDICHSFDYIFI